MEGCVQQTEWHKQESRFRAAAVTFTAHVFFIRVTTPLPRHLNKRITSNKRYVIYSFSKHKRLVFSFTCAYELTSFMWLEIHRSLMLHSPRNLCHACSGASSSRIFVDSIGEKKRGHKSRLCKNKCCCNRNFFNTNLNRTSYKSILGKSKILKWRSATEEYSRCQDRIVMPRMRSALLDISSSRVSQHWTGPVWSCRRSCIS